MHSSQSVALGSDDLHLHVVLPGLDRERSFLDRCDARLSTSPVNRMLRTRLGKSLSGTMVEETESEIDIKEGAYIFDSYSSNGAVSGDQHSPTSQPPSLKPDSVPPGVGRRVLDTWDG